ncbi:hypothetical protein VOLCADRAFT_75878 [Volvox carteri f. nagariensis]|uniref:2-phytyl-1,4-beta-naphthoquinone methyltransferase, chloroplastic n=1 Tax=Volvox carteri f. nagariensis TaxID=3068 RepID=D8U4K8_VOLCA|nr:uncharacterized protein VOLCADRAFT_75878 [Volvox carteri f. nagariensis]EFJ45291.1 hypothetical protein VOLCADRAFT_75878 [Volvox carteri f. nagariensis]|eukprot:XP_002953667.1 hypothetical protein VOLCADRAFT_75878 [Volvox carteri f. nagariensis]
MRTSRNPKCNTPNCHSRHAYRLWTPSSKCPAGNRGRVHIPSAASSEDNLPGPQGAFAPGQEAAARQGLFNRIAPVYDELNNTLSFGQHWVWKQMTVKWSGARPGNRALDVCCGSGDLAFLLARAVGPRGEVTGLDFAAEMLEDAAARQDAQRLESLPPKAANVTWVQGDAMSLPFEAASFDAATMGYGLRNVSDIPAALSELHRVLRPGCSAAILDFNNCTDPFTDAVQAFFLERLVVPAARRYGLSAEYEYLRPSIKRFPTGSELERLARQAGFATSRYYPIGFDLMGVLVATKGR